RLDHVERFRREELSITELPLVTKRGRKPRLDHALKVLSREVTGAERVLKAGVGRARKDVLGEPELLDVAKALETLVVDDMSEETVERHVPVDLIAHDERFSNHHSSTCIARFTRRS